MSDFGPAQENIGTFEQSTCVGEMDRDAVIALEAFAESSELHNQRGQDREPYGNENSYL